MPGWMGRWMKSFAGGETLEATGARVANRDILKLHLNEQTRRLANRTVAAANQEVKESRGVAGSLPSLLTIRASNRYLSSLETPFASETGTFAQALPQIGRAHV